MSLPMGVDTQLAKVLVTGGAGFIGSNLCQRLLEEGYRVICLDNLSTGFKKNIEAFLTNERFHFVQGDIRDFATCLSAADGCRFVFHQAALGSVPRSINDPLATNAVNITGFLNVLEASKQAKVQRFIFAASSSTYGDSTALPKVENQIGNPLSPYAVTKLVNELYADVFHRIYGMQYIGLRYFNVFGKNQDPDGAYAAVIPRFVKQLMALESPVINGDGSFSRDFTYIQNVVDANMLALSTKSENALNQIYNVACGEATTLKELAEKIRFNLSKKNNNIAQVPIVYGNQRTGDIPHSLASIEKIKSHMGYAPAVLIDYGLQEAVDWYWENI
jgi:UDP-N-acetylglucosamine/UDP-N-acetylgalactosamine 4-epimerase